MMAANAGAQHVYACEVLKPVAELARQIISENGFADKITIIDKSSTEFSNWPRPTQTGFVSRIRNSGYRFTRGRCFTFITACRKLLNHS